MKLKGTVGNDARTGTPVGDVFDYSQGGNDTLKGLGGNDTFKLGAKLGPLDGINGGAGIDTLTLIGNYAGGVTFGANTLRNVETIALGAGFNYKLVAHSNTV